MQNFIEEMPMIVLGIIAIFLSVLSIFAYWYLILQNNNIKAEQKKISDDFNARISVDKLFFSELNFKVNLLKQLNVNDLEFGTYIDLNKQILDSSNVGYFLQKYTKGQSNDITIQLKVASYKDVADILDTFERSDLVQKTQIKSLRKESVEDVVFSLTYTLK